MSFDEHVALAEKMLERVKGLIAETEADGWKITSTSNNVESSEKKLPDCHINCFRASTSVASPPKELAQKLWAADEALWKKLDGGVGFWKIVEQKDDTNRYVHQSFKCPWPVWDRDFVCLHRLTHEEDGTYMLLPSVSGVVEEDTAKFVRGDVRVSAFVFQTEGEGTKFTRICMVDPKGSIPTSVVNSSARTITTLAKNIRDILGA
mmetsp:Transcript_5592/g.14153  ORF Transcript_5592/g.14153 Transcript_5592/m.14153 type:complete len:206 (-) Transcript_5592:119-736(-)|eukprot:CAMPEP_0177647426 /NCGR_PEP_ID=MMETSP0447-20121125/10292_1 /TAXON_ID=0 /ORGANISM="Stygamoeba regulata, Strain BSH-02190019" /LENGTH=205 /DNA_ID=CAMNT_0019150007 /DNA_START=130 /DNA_END=747 /DNA_ORIENTATION=+